mmetsp:Transcript_21081/g.34888  ORF Transcript_21081/g.34888 Transcript_21081/m.34888 type:complete len:227 (-) Transcript_21081:196-876(-)|eukprot:CAMPEP_0119020038 /NCGR_PEP_ID=MMETSP1176-20130426/23201_1 /TAXON_ID=265551 /ORGANISM="Synedropsis recta cf, Strain CCMP1620" /LENGTH=226 /DNA_ID=CAMNT_0006974397 /DNA_START=160 /DNA_END=840 /DNA_ORIENTATION=+
MKTAAVTFKYIALGAIGGRGGVQRFFMLTHDIKFNEELFSPSEKWPVEKARMLETEENPCGAAPVTYLQGEAGESLHLSQHIAVCRYLARVNNINSGDAYKDYVQDLVADEYQGARDAWVRTAFGASNEEKATYSSETFPKKLKMFDTLYKKFKTSDDVSPYLSTNAAGKPLWGDCAIFGLCYDHIQTGLLKEEDLADYCNIAALYKSFAAIPAVASWIDEKSQQK